MTETANPGMPMNTAKERLAAYKALQERGDPGAGGLTAIARAMSGAYEADLLKQARAVITAAYRGLSADATAEDVEAAEAEAFVSLTPRLRQALREAEHADPDVPLETESWPDEDPPPREWLIPGLIPTGRLSSLYGMGEAGKSSLMLQIAAAVISGESPLKPAPETIGKASENLRADHALLRPVEHPGRVLWASWEDETDEMRRRWRLAHAAGAISVKRPDPQQLSWVNMRKLAASLWNPERGAYASTMSAWTTIGKRFLSMLPDYRLAVVDPLAAAYSGSELDRSLVRAFLSALDGAAEAAGCAVLLIAHPSQTGSAQGGSGYSGSTDWQAAPRAMLHLEANESGYTLESDKTPPAKAMCLRHGKANYAESGTRLWLVRHFEREDIEASRPAELAWFGASAREAAEAHEARAARIAGREARVIGGLDRDAGKISEGNPSWKPI